jgi:hypothetical protein
MVDKPTEPMDVRVVTACHRLVNVFENYQGIAPSSFPHCIGGLGSCLIGPIRGGELREQIQRGREIEGVSW